MQGSLLRDPCADAQRGCYFERNEHKLYKRTVKLKPVHSPLHGKGCVLSE